MDRERVFRAWECCNPFNRKCNECPYEKDCYHDGISRHMVADAIALLKEQAKTKVVFGRTKDGEFVTECGNCGTHLDKAYSNCPKCRKELDWNSNQT